jgi:predicted phosphoadenosine phosphosulfate sulfurtransferase
VLVLLPFRNSALEFVELLLKIVPKGLADRVANKKKFFAEFFDETFVPVSQKPSANLTVHFSAPLAVFGD